MTHWNDLQQDLDTALGKPVKRRKLFGLGSLITSITGASLISAISPDQANAAARVENTPNLYVPIAEKGVASGVATLDNQSKIPAVQLPDLSATFARPSVDTDFTAGLTDRGQRLLQVREAPLTPYQFGAVTPVLTSDNTTAIAALWSKAAMAANPEIRLPAGYWNMKGPNAGNLPLVSNLKISGAGRLKTQVTIANSSMRPMFSWNNEVSGVEMNSMYLNVGGGGGDIFAPGPTGGIHASTFRSMFISQQIPNRRIWFQDNGASFIHNTFVDVEMQRTTEATVTAFHIRSTKGAANFNLFEQVRINGSNNRLTPFFYFESSLAQTFLTDWTFINLLGEQNPGGMIHAAAAFNWTLINATDEDSTVPYSADLFRFISNSSGLAPRDLTFIGCGRRGSTLAPGVYDFNVAMTGSNITLINCNPTPTSATAKVLLPPNSTIIGGRNFPQQLQGRGSPEGVVTAVRGSTWMRSDGGVRSSFYVKESGDSNTGWVAK
ncbi:hypothetical protein ACFC25_01870 [Pseudarthrobacter sp. NPDC055928]|uniref:hypothetical protein n=1 Tax=Pseudarthrobacter sp. NPDC055928 TaxID=3345661 RepID=UPI0035E245E7